MINQPPMGMQHGPPHFGDGMHPGMQDMMGMGGHMNPSMGESHTRKHSYLLEQTAMMTWSWCKTALTTNPDGSSEAHRSAAAVHCAWLRGRRHDGPPAAATHATWHDGAPRGPRGHAGTLATHASHRTRHDAWTWEPHDAGHASGHADAV